MSIAASPLSRLIRGPVAVAMLAGLGACGQTGPLSQPSPVPAADQPAASDTESQDTDGADDQR
jgi:predicted small lipoprotein YifL